MATCDRRFDGKWNVFYFNEPQFSGTTTISFSETGVEINGTVLRNGEPDGSYVGSGFDCGESPTKAQFRYELATGHQGTMTLELDVLAGGSILGTYVDDGRGDTGLVELYAPNSSPFVQSGPEGFFSNRRAAQGGKY